MRMSPVRLPAGTQCQPSHSRQSLTVINDVMLQRKEKNIFFRCEENELLLQIIKSRQSLAKEEKPMLQRY